MQRRTFLQTAAAGLAAGALPARAATLAGSRPNLLLIMTDDQGMGDLSCMGNPDLKTPHMDAFGARSTRFTDFQVSPTCSPTRSCIMSGRHEFRNGVTHTILERERMALSTVTIAEVLRDAGYATGIFGKWHLGDEDEYQPGRRGFDEVFIHGAGGIGQAYECSCADAPSNQQNRYFDPVIRHNDRFVKTAGFCSDVFFRQALGWLNRQRRSDRPFFAYVTPNAPHGPMIAPNEFRQPFLDAGFDPDTAGRYGMIANLDDNLGRLVAQFDAWDLWRNTLVIFMTDNGQASRSGRKNGQPYPIFGAGLHGGKGSPFEGGTHVPAFWRWQGVLGEGVDLPALAAHLDLFPTFAELAGATPPERTQPLDGRSLVPLLEDPAAEWADRYLFTHVGRWDKGANPDEFKDRNCAVRSARYRLVANKMLFDIQADPGETRDVIGEHPDEVAAMRAAYDQWWAVTRPLMVNEDVPNSAVKPYFTAYEQQAANGGIPAWSPPPL